ncbi:MAG: S-adenosylmethionine decarboxylase proenzyme [Aquificota bacterium]|nr:MAG: S-adenosylmethionine decarboxylase proenzyme [Aquificota bacterium]
MKALGRHVLVEFYGCDSEALNNKKRLERVMRKAAVESGATVVSSVFHLFNPHGVSGVVVIAESHLTIHTWPEYGYAAVDLFTCGDSVDPWIAFEKMKEYLQAEQMFTMEIKRGQLHSVESLQYKPF